MPLSWNEIKERAAAFSKDWETEANEEAEAKSFLEGFFNVFDINRRRVSTFEHRVKKLDEKDGYIDLLWKGTILIEMKSRGKNLDKAFQQAKDYLHGLKQHELPKYILISDFEHLRLYDIEEDKTVSFKLSEFVNNVHHFGFLVGYQKKIYKEQDPANIKAAELMGKLHDRLEDIGYTGHALEVYLVRILFCLFAEDTTIFNKQQFQDYIEQRTGADGSDLAAKLQELFQVLNTPEANRFKNLDEQLSAFPYVNGKLYEEILPMASFDAKMRTALLECCYIDWSKISPAIFGSMFQSVMNPQERRNLGAHYTSEKNILKLIKPLFLDELWAEFESIKSNKNKLGEFHKKVAGLKFLDPACGCGNFLVITYRELRLLEMEIIRTLLFTHLKLRKEVAASAQMSINQIIQLNVDMMCGIEYEEFPARIAEVAMWLIDHQMNMLISNEFGEYFVRLPLKKAAKIVHNNALQTDWNTVVPNEELSYILGNPPFVGQQLQNSQQKRDVKDVLNSIDGYGVLDYVAAWYVLSAQYIQGTKIKVAFVSTNSISQGEQAGTLWNYLYHRYNIKIHFAHRTFNWSNEAKGRAAVHCIIVGFANFDVKGKKIYEYESINGEPHEVSVANINPYLFEGKDFALISQPKPIGDVPEIKRGNSPYDGGYFLFSEEERNDFLRQEPASEKFFKKFIAAKEFIHDIKKYCLWLKDANPAELNKLPLILDRVKKVKEFRETSPGKETQSYAKSPTVFRDKNNPDTFIVIPRHSSENRKYVPIGYFFSDAIPGDTCMIVPNGSPYLFGHLTSEMHMAWLKNTCGRIKSDYRYSKDIVYNNYPFPPVPTPKQKSNVEEAAQTVLIVRKKFAENSLADLYSPLTMPSELLKAHQQLDKAVDACYRSQPFTTEAVRMEFLFDLYSQYTKDLFTNEKPKKKATAKK